MSLAATSFTPGPALAGGTAIALSTCLLFATTGRLAGLSGIFEGASLLGDMKAAKDNFYWKGSFFGGFVIGTFFIEQKMAGAITMGGLATPPVVLVVAGGLVGLGARLGSGCTSGHGICGMARLSKRSIVAVVTFMATGAAVSSLCQELGVLGRGPAGPPISPAGGHVTSSGMPEYGNIPSSTVRTSSMVIAGLELAGALAMSIKKRAWPASLASAVSGFIFAVGLGISGMGNRAKIWHFLTLDATWDPSLMLVMGSAIPMCYAGFKLAQRWWTQPLVCCSKVPEDNTYHLPTKTAIDAQLVTGAALFGVGWGLGGLCPGPALMQAAVGIPNVWMYFMPGMLGGMFVAGKVAKASFWNGSSSTKAK